MSKSQITMDEIKKNLRKFLRRVEAGESLMIVKSGKPIAEIKPMTPTPSKIRPFGLCEGDFTVPEDFDAQLPEDIIKAFEGK